MTDRHTGRNAQDGDLLSQAILFLEGRCDGAQKRDGMGFNKFDAEFGRELAEKIKAEQALTLSERSRAYKMLAKYRGQLSEAGINYDDIPPPARPSRRTEAKATATTTIPPNEMEHLTDLGNAQRLVRLRGKDLRYCAPWGKWLLWDGTRWRVDDTGGIMREARKVIPDLYAEAARLADEAAAVEDKHERDALRDKAEATLSWAEQSESRARLEALVALARSEADVVVRPAELDADPWLLNCTNGTLDLRTGELREHRREDLITKLAPVEYHPKATCPTWDAFLERIMNGSQELIAFLKRAVGYALTGDTSEQALFMLYGTGANGKSTFLETLRAMLGDYAGQTNFETLLTKERGGTIPNDIAALHGKRFVSTVEVEGGRRLAEVVVKQLTGGDMVTARFLYQEFFEFMPQFKLL